MTATVKKQTAKLRPRECRPYKVVRSTPHTNITKIDGSQDNVTSNQVAVVQAAHDRKQDGNKQTRKDQFPTKRLFAPMKRRAAGSSGIVEAQTTHVKKTQALATLEGTLNAEQHWQSHSVEKPFQERLTKYVFQRVTDIWINVWQALWHCNSIATVPLTTRESRRATFLHVWSRAINSDCAERDKTCSDK